MKNSQTIFIRKLTETCTRKPLCIEMKNLKCKASRQREREGERVKSDRKSRFEME